MGRPAQGAQTSSDQRLIEALRAGDDDAFERVLEKYGARLLALARRFMRTEQDAHDAFQDAMLSAFLKIDSFRGADNLYGWLYRVTVNACLMQLRKRQRHQSVDIDSLLPTFDERDCRINEPLAMPKSPEELLASEETRETIRQAVDALPDRLRSVFILRDVEGHSTRETAELLEIEEGAVKTRLHRGRSALKKVLEPALFGEGEGP